MVTVAAERARRGSLIAVMVACFILVVVSLVRLVDNRIEQETLPDTSQGTGLTDDVSVAADLHGIEIPVNATGIRYTVTSSIDAESFGLTFVTDDAGLSSFLRSIERETSDLVVNANPWEVTLERTTSRYGWDLSKISNFAGLSVPRAEAGFDSYAVLVEYLDERVQVFLDAQQV